MAYDINGETLECDDEGYLLEASEASQVHALKPKGKGAQ